MSKIEKLLIFEGAVNAALIFYIFRPVPVYAILCFTLVLLLEIGVYFLLKKGLSRNKH